jgi:predicted RNase H-like HicB family nuclease
MSEVLLNLHIEPLEEGGYVATSDQLPGLVAQGETVEETLDIARDVARMLLESYLEHGDPVPAIFKAHRLTAMELAIPLSLPA